jgi:hypothetical protein
LRYANRRDHFLKVFTFDQILVSPKSRIQVKALAHLCTAALKQGETGCGRVTLATGKTPGTQMRFSPILAGKNKRVAITPQQAAC